MDIYTLNNQGILSIRTVRALGDVEQIGELSAWTMDELRDLPGMGRKCIAEVLAAMTVLDLPAPRLARSKRERYQDRGGAMDRATMRRNGRVRAERAEAAHQRRQERLGCSLAA